MTDQGMETQNQNTAVSPPPVVAPAPHHIPTRTLLVVGAVLVALLLGAWWYHAGMSVHPVSSLAMIKKVCTIEGQNAKGGAYVNEHGHIGAYVLTSVAKDSFRAAFYDAKGNLIVAITDPEQVFSTVELERVDPIRVAYPYDMDIDCSAPEDTKILLSVETTTPASDTIDGMHTTTADTVSVGGSIRVGSEAMQVVRVVSDSRCPIDVTCVWAGEVVVEVKPEAARASQEHLYLSNLGEPYNPDYKGTGTYRDGGLEFNNYVIKIESVSPARKSTGDIPQEGYRIGMSVTPVARK